MLYSILSLVSGRESNIQNVVWGTAIPTAHKYATSEDQDESAHLRSQIKVCLFVLLFFLHF